MSDERYVFPAPCPKCGLKRPQEHLRAPLEAELRAGRPIKAYCIACDEHWQLSESERDRLAQNFQLE